jgi:hypothetical protein
MATREKKKEKAKFLPEKEYEIEKSKEHIYS